MRQTPRERFGGPAETESMSSLSHLSLHRPLRAPWAERVRLMFRSWVHLQWPMIFRHVGLPTAIVRVVVDSSLLSLGRLHPQNASNMGAVVAYGAGGRQDGGAGRTAS